jgi:LruC domain-containing protein
MPKLRKIIPWMATLLVAPWAHADPFATCPTQAFLVQGKPAVIYGVDLSSGEFNPLGDLNTPDKLNGMGFNYADGYLYAWHYADQTLARIHSDYRIEPLPLGKELNSNYYIGDVAVEENAYYAYRKNGSYGGLWRISLDQNDVLYLDPQQVVSETPLYLSIFDFAFHPNDGFIYSVDNVGRLYRIDSTSATYELLGNVGVSGTFGAVYFDVDGTLYISRNQDGKIYSVDLETAQSQFFSYGPSSSNNDGARCALAPVELPAVPTMDFGDAPVSYGTRASEDGARHVVNTQQYLGSLVDAENRAFPGPDESDDTKDGSDDEDGVQFLTDIRIGENTIATAEMFGDGYLNMWIDYNGNGAFDADEQAITDADSEVSSGTFTIEIPSSAKLGPTWVRVRFSSVSGLGATGAAPDGEVEDYPVNIMRAQTRTEHYPSENGFVTLAFEDLWPSIGDYDLNDFVVYYRTSITTDISGDAESVQQITISGEIAAVGASFHSGFAISIPGVKTSDIDADNIVLLINGETPISADGDAQGYFKPLRGEASRQSESALLEITRDVWNTVQRGEGCSFHRTENNCGAASNALFSLTIPMSTAVPVTDVAKGIFNPFVFSTNGYTRNSIFKDEQGNVVPPGDRLEIHLKNQAPSWRADGALLGRADDVSELSSINSENRTSYQNSNGLPWAIEIGGRWCHPGEYQDVTIAYPDFVQFVASEGDLASDWFYTNNAAIHHQRGTAGYLYKEDGVLDDNCAGIK